MPFDKEKAAAFLESDDYKKLSPQDQQAVVARMRVLAQQGTTPAPTAPKPQPLGFVTRAGQGLGIPTTGKELEAMQPSTAEKIIGPAATGAKMGYAYGKNLYTEGKKAASEIGETFTQGGDIGPRLGKAAAATSEFILKGLLGPVGGGAVQAWGEDINSKNYSGAAGSALAVLVNALLLHGSRPLADKSLVLPATTKVDKLFFAGNLPDTLHPAEVQAVLPDLAEAAKGKGPPKTVGALSENINAAKANSSSEVGRAMFNLRGEKFSTQPIADAIKSHITPEMEMTKDGQAMAKALNKAAAEYTEKAWTAEQLHFKRIRANADLASFYKKGTIGQYGDVKTNVGVMVDKAVGDTIRDIMYPEMDRAVGAPPGYYRSLLTRHGTLIEMGDAVSEQATALAAKTAKIRGGPRLGENVSLYQSHMGVPGVSAHKIQNIFKHQNPLAKANAAVSRAYSGRPVPKAIINSLPVRNLMLLPQVEPLPPKGSSAGDLMKNAKGKPPGQQKKDLEEIQQKYSNPMMPVGPEAR